ncbi:MAG: hypothetical protein JWQ11_3379, partial [Rhizobacter sp.]|nr:hypothetical protein [Rhizobacter sp.]
FRVHELGERVGDEGLSVHDCGSWKVPGKALKAELEAGEDGVEGLDPMTEI